MPKRPGGYVAVSAAAMQDFLHLEVSALRSRGFRLKCNNYIVLLSCNFFVFKMCATRNITKTSADEERAVATQASVGEEAARSRGNSICRRALLDLRHSSDVILRAAAPPAEARGLTRRSVS